MHSCFQCWAIGAITSGVVPDVIVDFNHTIEYLKYVATQKLLDRKGGERSVDQHPSAVSANPTPISHKKY